MFNGGGATFHVVSDGSDGDPFGDTFQYRGAAGQGHSGTFTNFTATCDYPNYAQGYYAGTDGSDSVYLFSVDYGAPMPPADELVYELYALDMGNTAIVQLVGLDRSAPLELVKLPGGASAYRLDGGSLAVNWSLGQPVVLKFSRSGTTLLYATALDSFTLSSVTVHCAPWQPFTGDFTGDTLITGYVQTRTAGRWLSAPSGNSMISFRGDVTMTDNVVSWGCDDAMCMRRHILVPISRSGDVSVSPVSAFNATSITFTALSRLLQPPDLASVSYNLFYARSALGQTLTIDGEFALFACMVYTDLGDIAPIHIVRTRTLLSVTLVASPEAMALLPANGSLNFWVFERAAVNHVVVRNNVLGPNRGHGMIVDAKTSTLIQHNLFINNFEGAVAMPYILVDGAAPLPSNMIVDSNYMYLDAAVSHGQGIGEGAIVLFAVPISAQGLKETNPLSNAPSPPGGMYNLSITNNVIQYMPPNARAGIIVGGVANLNLQNNTILANSSNTVLVPYTITSCSGVTNLNNSFLKLS